MPKNKKPAARKSGASPEDLAEAHAQKICDLALDLAEREEGEEGEEGEGKEMSGALKEMQLEFQKMIKKCLLQKKDEVLYDALERTRYADIDAYQFVKQAIEEASEVILSRRDDGPVHEVNAFVIPVFVRSMGGLHAQQSFQDQEAFDLLSNSFQSAQLESADATVVLVSYAYHLDEIDRITYSQIYEMTRDAQAAMSGKKNAGIEATERSFSGWPANRFAPGDAALEIRFLLGFALKSMDDPFYQIPQDEAASDAYFEAREQRFQQWTVQAAPLVKRCLVMGGGVGEDGDGDADSDVGAHGRVLDVDFLYQDLFHGAKERGIAEYFLLQMVSELNGALGEQAIAPHATKAVIGPADVGHEMVLRVNLYAMTGPALLASAAKPFGETADLQLEADDVRDALRGIGVESFSLALKFDSNGAPVDVRPFN